MSMIPRLEAFNPTPAAQLSGCVRHVWNGQGRHKSTLFLCEKESSPLLPGKPFTRAVCKDDAPTCPFGCSHLTDSHMLSRHFPKRFFAHDYLLESGTGQRLGSARR